MTAKPVTFGPEDEAELDIMSILTDPKQSEAGKKGALVEEILHRFTIKTLEDTNEMLYYDAGVYKGGAEAKIIDLDPFF